MQEIVKDISAAMGETEQNILNEVRIDRENMDSLKKLVNKLNERQGNKGVPTADELCEKLDEINRGVESEHMNLIVSEIQNLDARIKQELSKSDLRLNAVEDAFQNFRRELELQSRGANKAVQPLSGNTQKLMVTKHDSTSLQSLQADI